MLAMFWYGSISVRDMPRILTFAGIETGIVMLLVGDSAILAKVLQVNGFGSSLQSFLLDLTSDKYVFLLAVNVLLLLVGIFVEPLPALFIFAPFLAPIADHFGMDPTHFGLLVLFLVSSISKVPIERLSIMILPWLGVSLLVLALVTYLPSSVVLVLVHHQAFAGKVLLGLFALAVVAAVIFTKVGQSKERA
jgi:C4-dicarboxylate transporter DctM subunit